jgi:Superfamily I DNA and RNA helicases
MNESQREAVTTTEGPLLLIAGPGSGKTLTLVNRAVHLLIDQKVPPERIMISTFTRKAAFELQSRLLHRLRELGETVNVQDMLIGTLHAIFLKLLEKYRPLTHLRNGFRLLDDFDLQYIIYRNLDRFLEIDNAVYLTLKDGSYKDPTLITRTQRLMYWLNKVNEEMLDSQQLIASNDVPIRALGEAYHLYEQLLAEENALDFGMIQMTMLRLLERHPDVLAEISSSIDYMMIDEYQDTNTIQEKLILLLAGTHGNLCVVGDDDQSIYRFRGATVQNLVRFEDHFEPGACKVIELGVNYRSHPRIINFFNSWMKLCNWKDGYGTSYRLEKAIKPDKPDNGKTSRVIKLAGNRNEQHWHGEVYRFLRHVMEQGIISDWNQVAFLFRSVRSPEVKRLADYLEKRDIPVFAPRRNAYFDRPEVQLVIGTFGVLLSQIIDERKLPEYIKRCMTLLKKESLSPGHMEFVSWVKTKRPTFNGNLASGSFIDLFYELLQFTMFHRLVSTKDLGSAQESREVRNMAMLTKWILRFEQLQELAELEFAEKAAAFFDFIAYVQEIGQDEYEDESDYAPSGSISFFTYHQSKGLEFPIVVTGSLDSIYYAQSDWVEEALRPYYARKPFEPLAQTSEYDFYRLFYTAFSRAQELLVLTGNEQGPDYRGRGQLPSVYLEPLYRRLRNWSDPQVYLDELKVTPIKPIVLQRSYAYTTDIAVYSACPRYYLLCRVFGFESAEGAPALLGTLVHYIIEDMHQALKAGIDVTEAHLAIWISEHFAPFEQLGIEDPAMKQIVYQHARSYLEYVKVQGLTVMSSELAVSSFVGDYLMNGKLDAVMERNGSYEIIDFKTGRKPQSEGEQERYKKQLLLYASLWEQRTGMRVDAMRLFYTGEEKGEQVVTFAREECELQAVNAEMAETIQLIESKQFDVNISPLPACSSCDFKWYCHGVRLK